MDDPRITPACPRVESKLKSIDACRIPLDRIVPSPVWADARVLAPKRKAREAGHQHDRPGRRRQPHSVPRPRHAVAAVHVARGDVARWIARAVAPPFDRAAARALERRRRGAPSLKAVAVAAVVVAVGRVALDVACAVVEPAVVARGRAAARPHGGAKDGAARARVDLNHGDARGAVAVVDVAFAVLLLLAAAAALLLVLRLVVGRPADGIDSAWRFAARCSRFWNAVSGSSGCC